MDSLASEVTTEQDFLGTQRSVATKTLSTKGRTERTETSLQTSLFGSFFNLMFCIFFLYLFQFLS